MWVMKNTEDGKIGMDQVSGPFMVNIPLCRVCFGWVVSQLVEFFIAFGGVIMQVPIKDIMAQVVVDDLIMELVVLIIITEVEDLHGVRKVVLIGAQKVVLLKTT